MAIDFSSIKLGILLLNAYFFTVIFFDKGINVNNKTYDRFKSRTQNKYNSG